MALTITIGQYWPGKSILHRLDPRTKLICLLAIFVSSLAITGLEQLILSWLVLAALVACAHIPLGRLLASVKPVVMVLLVLSLFTLLWTQGGTVLFSWGILRISTAGVWAAILSVGRLMLAILAGALLLLTTTPTQISDALDKLLGTRGHTVAMIIALTLRFVPILAQETTAILEAQTLRGASLTRGTMRQRLHAIQPLLIALFAAAVRHANNLALALDARNYESGAARTHLHPLAFERRDAAAFVLSAAYIAALWLLA